MPPEAGFPVGLDGTRYFTLQVWTIHTHYIYIYDIIHFRLNQETWVKSFKKYKHIAAQDWPRRPNNYPHDDWTIIDPALLPGWRSIMTITTSPNDSHALTQIHYNNNNHLAGVVDSSGFKLVLTPHLRPKVMMTTRKLHCILWFHSFLLADRLISIDPKLLLFTPYIWIYLLQWIYIQSMWTLTLGQMDLTTPPGMANHFTRPNICGTQCTALIRPLKMVTSFLHMHEVSMCFLVSARLASMYTSFYSTNKQSISIPSYI